MTAVLVDTHALIWYVEADPRLSTAARTAIDAAIQAGSPIFMSSISLAEIVYLAEKGRIASDLFERIRDALRQGTEGLTEVAFDHRIAELLRSIPWSVVRDLPDRIIAATALFLGVPLITRDSAIRASSVPTVW